MDNQVFLPQTFAEIYNNTPESIRGLDVSELDGLYIATIQYAGKPADLVAIVDRKHKICRLVLVDETGCIL